MNLSDLTDQQYQDFKVCILAAQNIKNSLVIRYVPSGTFHIVDFETWLRFENDDIINDLELIAIYE